MHIIWGRQTRQGAYSHETCLTKITVSCLNHYMNAPLFEQYFHF